MSKKFHCNLHRPAFPLWLLLSGLLTMSAAVLAQDPYPAELKALCSSYGRPQPVMDTPDECTTCHTLDDYTRNEKGNVWERYRPGLTAPVNPGEIPNVLATFCPAVFYNAKTGGALAPDWKPQPPSFGTDGKGYEGKLAAYWLALLANDHQTLTLSRADAAYQKLSKFSLRTAPDNCWGNSMNFGLISLAQRAKLTITVAADNSPSYIPGFALYQGWDGIGSKAVRHDTIYFGDNGPGRIDSENPPADGIISTPNPLGTQGLSYLAHKLGTIPGGTAELTQTLDAGQYELFVTVGDNFASSDGDYLVTLKTEPVEAEGTYNILIDPPPTGGTIRSAPAGIDCGSQCSGSFKTGTAVTLTALAADGQRFASWTGDCAAASGPECTVTDKATVGATFEILKHTVTIHRSGDGSVTSTPAGLDCGPVCAFDFTHDETVGLVATPGADQLFQGWNGACVGTDPVCILTVNNPLDVSAAFAPKPVTPPAPEPTTPPAPSQVDGSCGTANNVFSGTAPVTPNLCQTGVSTQPAALPDGRFTWSCLGVGANSQIARCYTQANNGKRNQPPLKLLIGKANEHKGATLTVTGGAGKGKPKVIKSATAGTRCKTSLTGRRIRVKFGGASGTCTLSVKKVQDKTYNEVESPPLVLKVNR